MNAAVDRLDDSYPHGTVEGYRRGCRGGVCPAGEQHGLSCRRAGQLHAGDYRYQKLAKRGLTPAEIADELGLVPETNAAPAPKPSSPAKREPSPAEPEPAPPVEDTSQNEEPTMTEPNEPTAPAEPTEPTAPPAADTAAHEIPSQSVIRAWARKNGIEVNPRGSVQKGVVNAYLAAHRAPIEAEPAATLQEEPTDRPAEASPEGLKVHAVEYDEIRDFARNSDILDETRRRLGMEEHPSSWVRSQEVLPTTVIRPEWADVAVSHDVEQARSLAARIEAENAILLEQLATVSSSLEFALRQWAAATDRATSAEHHKIGAQLRALDAEEQRDTANTALAETTVELNAALARVALLESQVGITQPAATPIRRVFGNVR